MGLATIFRISPAAITITTAREGRILEVNETFAEMSGWDREDAVGRTEEELEWWGEPADRERIVAAVREAGAVREEEVQIRTRSGGLREALVSADLLELDGEETLLALFHDIGERRRMERELERLALHDPLTDLPNRTLFKDRLIHALERSGREGTGVAVLFVDLDRFKVVNDTLGHAAGDELLKAVADRLRGCFRKEDTVARLGGDEFAAVLESAGGQGEARGAARRITVALQTPFKVGGTELQLSASVGIALAEGGTGRWEDLVRFADIAMYRAKTTPGAGYRFFDPVRDAGATQRLHQERELREALARDEFILLYQPVVDLRTGKIAGCEALLRWEHPERGLLLPESFIPLAEDAGLIVAIGKRILEQAFRDLKAWRRLPGEEEFLLSVNLSPRQFQEPRFIEGVGESVLQAGMSPGCVQLEITESLLLRAMGKLRRLRRLGFRLAIDDFGTGYSSLHYLKDMDVDVLKVDGSFIQGIGRRADELILRTVTQLGHALGMEVVAEHVETQAQHQFLRKLGCDFGQGYLYSTPLPAPLFERLLGQPEPASAAH